MHILIKQPEKINLNLYFPTSLVANRLTVSICNVAIKKNTPYKNLNINGDDILRLFHEIRRLRKSHPKLVLVDIESSDGVRVSIQL